jgi:hypothetical protein
LRNIAPELECQVFFYVVATGEGAIALGISTIVQLIIYIYIFK